MKTYNGWTIKGVGGFSTIRHFWAAKGALAFWTFKLREAKALIDQLNDGSLTSSDIPEFHKRPLYH
jgi:hypothetical protein